MTSAFHILCWLLVAALGLVAVARVVAWDSLQWLTVLDALTLEIYLPIWGVAAVALLARRWWLAIGAVAEVVAQLMFMAPVLLAAGPVPAWADHAPSVKVFDANVDKSGNFQVGYVRAITQDKPDLIAFEEFTPGALASMRESGILVGFPFRCSAPAWGATGFFIASRLRMTDCRVQTAQWDGQSVPYMVDGTLWLPSGPVALRLVHPLAPFPAYWREWTTALADISQSVRASGTGRMLMVGDFNATWGNRGFTALLGDGLTDGAAARGQAMDMTWPSGAIVPAFARIDHVLTGEHLAVTKTATSPGFGSDHRYLTVTVAVQK